MSALAIFLELQAVHDNLSTIQRDLTAFPPDLAKLDSDLKNLAKKLEASEKVLSESTSTLESLGRNLQVAEKNEAIAKAAVKSATQKVQFTAAIRELDEKERQKAAVVRPMKEAEGRRARSQKDVEELRARQAELKGQFDALHEVFLSEHENQVVARARLQTRKEELEQQLGQPEVSQFNRLLHQRQGKALALVENGTCTGCRTRIRTPMLSQLRERASLTCESCQRILYTRD